MKRTLISLALVLLMAASVGGVEQWVVSETSFTSAKKYDNPFVDVAVDVVFRSGDLQWPNTIRIEPFSPRSAKLVVY